MSTASVVLDWARAVGTMSAGFTAGIFLGTTLIQLPAESATLKHLSLHDKLRLWSATYTIGAGRLPFFLVLSPVSLLLAAYLAPPAPAYVPAQSTFLGWIAAHRQGVLAMSGVTMSSIVAWTLIVMGPNIKSLLEKEKKADAQKDYNLEDTPKMIESWSTLHRLRIVLSTIAFTGGILDLIAS